ncbi:MAG: response regulator transcription factor [Syntrophobacterales bacterium]|nr:response regulator transcription factor [Syntrophobacterales bacterium]
MRPFRVLLADDHAMFRQGVRRLLEEIPGVEVVGEAGDGLELLKLLQRVTPHLVVLDLSMPRLRGVEALYELKSACPAAKVLVLTMHKEREYLYHALKAGVAGFLVKEDAVEELEAAVQALRQGKKYFSPRIAPEMQEMLADEYQGRGGGVEEVLSLREKQVLKLIAEGRSSKEIAELLFISQRTVHNHRANILRKLRLKRITDLVRYAVEKGLTG